MLAAMVFACSAATAVSMGQSEPTPTLDETLTAERLRADVSTSAAPVPLPESIADWGTPPTDVERANRSASDILHDLRSSFPASSNTIEVSAADTERALASYRQAEKHIADRQPERAIAALRQSLRLDPTSIEAWRLLGVLLDEQSNPIASKAAYAEAVALGDRDPLTLIRFGRLASRFREDPLAAVALLTALRSDDQPDDAGAALAAHAELGQTLLRLGYLAESVRAIESVADLPSTFEGETDFRSSINDLYRDRRELLLRGAEASHSIGEIDRAQRLLQAAANIPGPRTANESAVRAYMLLRTGRPAEAASLVVARFERPTTDTPAIDLLRYVAEHSGYGEQIESELQRAYASLPAEQQAIARQAFALARAALGESPNEQASTLLEHLRTHPYDLGVLIELARTGDTESIDRLIRVHPAMEPRISRIALDVGTAALESGEGPLAIRAMLRAGHFHRALDAAIEGADAPRTNFHMLALQVELLSEAARSDKADELLDRALANAQTPSDRAACAHALLARSRYRDALAVLDDPALQLPGPNRVHSQIARILALDALGDRNETLRTARNTLQSDSACLPAAAFLARYGGDPDDRRRLLDISGADGLYALLQGISAFEQEQFDLAERSLISAWRSPVRPSETPAVLVDLWERTASIKRAEEWLRGEAARYPDQPMLTALLARLQSDDRRPEEALETLASRLMDRPGSIVLSRELERVLRVDFDANDRWLSQARTRLDNAPDTFAKFAERASVELAGENLDQAISMMELATDLAPTLTRVESETINGFLETVSTEITNRPRVRPEAVAAYTRVFERLDTPSRGAWLGRISVASIKELPTSDEMAQLALQAGRAHPDIAEQAFVYAVQAVMTSSRTGQTALNNDESRQLALDLYAEATTLLEPYPARVLGSWIEFSQQVQDPFVLGEAIRSLGEYGGPSDRRLREALTYVMFRNSARQDPQLSAQMLADGAHHLASQLSLNDQFDTARLLYEEALRAKPDHVETNNSYGYRLLELGEQVERAVSMIETAYASSPQEPHIIDSLGWARYKQGRLEDSTDPQTGRPTPGALSLLRRAKTMAIEADPTGFTTAPIVDHLGDALWASGDRDGAVLEWTEAAVLATRASKGVRGLPLPLSVEIELQDLIQAASEKVRAASEDREPKIAPQLETASPR